MPYLTCVGGHGVVGKNKSGAGARGYWVYRRGKTVIRRYGPVTIARARGVAIHWLRYKEAPKVVLPSIADARAFVREVVREKTDRGYTLLGPGVRIRKPLNRR